MAGSSSEVARSATKGAQVQRAQPPEFLEFKGGRGGPRPKIIFNVIFV